MRDSIFVDWLAMHQVHHGCTLPRINNGCVWSVDHDGEVEWTTDRGISVEGSHDTKLRLLCDGLKVVVSGNIGRFHRPDNLFGWGYEVCIKKWNEVLAGYDLPPFSAGEPFFEYGSDTLAWTGAVNTQIDLTRNYCLFNRDDLQAFMGWMGTQQRGRLKVGVSPDGGTISWGEGSKYVYEIFYDKYLELQKHKKKNKFVAPDVLEYVKDVGVGRHELKLKTRFLTQNGYRYMGGVNMGLLKSLYRERSSLLTTDSLPYDDFNDIPKPFRSTANDWRNGVCMREAFSRTTYYRHRRELLKYGIDISVKCDVARIKPKIRHIQCMGLIPPEWYLERYG